MSARQTGLIITLVLMVLSVGLAIAQVSESVAKKPQPKSIELNLSSSEYQRLLGGPPDSVTMRSGLVTLAPGKTVGKHNTEDYEEVLIVLQGQGKMMMSEGNAIVLKYGLMLYCPPGTEHDVQNTGTEPLKYIYIVAKAK